MSSLPPELAGPVEKLRKRLVEINSSEQACMTNALLTKSFTEAQAVMARCRQSSAAAAATAVDAFLHECSENSCYRQKRVDLLGQLGELGICPRV